MSLISWEIETKVRPMRKSPTGQVFSFLPDGGQTGALVRSIDWSQHPLGSPDQWPSTLKVTLGIIFGSRHPMFLWWGADLIQFYNDAYLPSFGQGKHPVSMGQKGAECWPEIWPIISPQINAVLTQGISSWNENHLVPIFRNGKLEDVYWTYGYSPVLGENGKIEGVLVVCTETTQQLLATQALRASEEDLKFARQELESFLLQAPIGIAILSGPNHIYTFLNPSYMSLLFAGRQQTDFIGKSVRKALPELQGQGFYEILDDVYRTGKSFVGAKLRASLIQANGTEKEMYVNFTYQAKRDRFGKIDGILVVVYEVTDQVNEQKEIELLAENLRAAIISRDAFLGVASHELNTPLTSLKLQTQMTKRAIERQGIRALPPDKIQKLLDHTLVQIERLGRLVDDMLDVSRISSGKLTINRVETNLSALVQDVFDRFYPQFESEDCHLTTDISPNITASLDASRIEQVLTNFIMNAIKYAPGKSMHAKVERTGAMAKVSLHDKGNGIALENQERIFERFERATPQNEVSGLGLGLYICKQIIQEHAGKIYVESVLGQGSTFSFEIPV
jgi:signal transduction histidine kinase